jgi:hypothetical protein
VWDILGLVASVHLSCLWIVDTYFYMVA